VPEHCHPLIQAQCVEERHRVLRVSKIVQKLTALPYFTTLNNSKIFTFKKLQCWKLLDNQKQCLEMGGTQWSQKIFRWNPNKENKKYLGGTLINKRKRNLGWNPNKRNEKLKYFEISNRKIGGSQKIQIIHDIEKVN